MQESMRPEIYGLSAKPPGSFRGTEQRLGQRPHDFYIVYTEYHYT
jgi:hypothetical protein